jgi:hypothetical protein
MQMKGMRGGPKKILRDLKKKNKMPRHRIIPRKTPGKSLTSGQRPGATPAVQSVIFLQAFR